MKRALCLAAVLALFTLSGCTLDELFGGLVNQIPEAVIDASDTEGMAPLTVRFSAGYSHDDKGIADYFCDFGDPHDTAPQAELVTTHTYLYPGTYLVKLTVIDAEGKLDSEKLAVVVQNPPPVPNLALSDDAPHAGDEVDFDATASYDPNGTISSFAWDFGDGESGSGVKVSHTYAVEGSYVVALTVTDNEGMTATVHHGITVQKEDCGGGGCGGGGDVPLAVITGLPSCSGGRVGVPIRFDGSASRAAVGQLVLYHWDFGDGSTGSGARVDYAYSRSGTFLVRLTVTDENGRTATAAGSCPIENCSGT